MSIRADLTEAPRGLIRATLTIPVKPGPLTLVYPQWLPGDHGPTGPIADLTGLKFSAAGKTIPWRRDLTDMFAMHLEIPPGVTTLDVNLESVASNSGGPSEDPTTTSQLTLLNWNVITLFPQGSDAAKISVDPSLILPAGWSFGTSLEQLAKSPSGGAIQFRPVSLEMLIDQPVLAGKHFKQFDLTPGAKLQHVIDAAADSEAALAINPERLKAFERIPAEFGALFGARHYERYHFLLALSDQLHQSGLEHHQCSANRATRKGAH